MRFVLWCLVWWMQCPYARFMPLFVEEKIPAKRGGGCQTILSFSLSLSLSFSLSLSLSRSHTHARVLSLTHFTIQEKQDNFEEKRSHKIGIYAL